MARQKSSWGGKQAESRPKHRWQAGKAKEGAVVSSRRVWEWRILITLFLILVSVLVWLLLVSAKRTPVISFSVTEYIRPVPPNAWAQEATAGLLALSDTSGNLDVNDLSPLWKQTSDGKAAWQEALTKQGQLRQPLFWKDPLPLIVYINMHGVVDNDGIPSLLTPGASPLKNDTLLSVSEVLRKIKERIPDSRKKLLILDSQQILAEWNMGIPYNTFAHRVEDVVLQERVPNLAVMTSAAPGQQSWAAPQLHNSVFGKFLQFGLAGAADGVTPEAENGEVSLFELAEYLKTEVDRWAIQNRGVSQTPRLFADGMADFRLTTVSAEKLAELELPKSASPAADVGLGDLWTKMDGLKSFRPIRYDPIGWRELEHQLLRLERLVDAGAGYADVARRESGEVASRLDKLAAERPADFPLASQSSIFSGLEPSWDRLKLHTLPLREYFGLQVDPAKIQELLAHLTDPALDSEQSLKAFSDAVAKSPAVPIADFGISHFLYAARRQQVATLWGRSSLPADLFQLRQRSEQLAIPRDPEGRAGDERAHYYVRAALAIADRSRRATEDTLFVGPDTSADFDGLLTDTRNFYDRVGAVRQSVERAFTARDRIWAEAPYLASWLCRPLDCETETAEALVTAEEERDRSIAALVRTIDENRKLSEELTEFDQLGDDLKLPFESQTDDLVTRYEQIRKPFEKKLTELVAERNPRTLRALQAVLSTPLIPAERRKELLAMRRRVAGLLHQSYLQANTETALSASAAKDAPATDTKTNNRSGETAYVKRLAGWEVHPLSAILRCRTSEAEDPVSAVEENGQFVRQHLVSLESLEIESADEVVAHRKLLADLEQRIRSASSIWFPAVNAATEINRLRNFDLQQLLVWHLEQAIEDFWNAQLGEESEPFFMRAAEDYRQAADVFGEKPRAVANQIATYTALLEKRQEALSGLQLTLEKSSPIPEEPDSSRMEVAIQQASGDLSFPVGSAALFVRKDTGEGDVTPRVATADEDLVVQPVVANGETEKLDRNGVASTEIELPLSAGQAKRFVLLAMRTKNLGGSPKAIAYFRGHSFSLDLEAKPLTGVNIAYEPHIYGPPQITLAGDRRQRSAFVFVLDCSQSMNEEIRLEGANGGGAGETAPRIQLAKGHLTEMLDELAQRNFLNGADETHVGVRLFGHRVGWSSNMQSIVKQKEQERRGHIPPRLAPALDSESLLRLGRFDNGNVHPIRRRIEPILGHGQSPLYFSLVEALKEFPSVGRDTRKEIIAITDGVNVQYIKSDEEDAGVTRTRKEDLVRKWNDLKKREVSVRINFLDFGGRDAKEFESVAKYSGGTYEHVTSGRDLIRLLRERLDLDGYTVDDWRNPPRSLNRVEEGSLVAQTLNTALEFEKEQFSPMETYHVKFRDISKPVFLEGGEAVELQLDDADIRAIPYERGETGIGPLLKGVGGVSAGHLFRVHTPIRDGEAVLFKVSLQQDPRILHFTRRPKETWVEITPVFADSTESKMVYSFYDTNFEPNEPVPVLRWKADKWPRESNRAKVAFWCKEQPTRSRPILLAAVRNAPVEFNRYQPVPEVGGISMLVRLESTEDTYEVNIIERHEATSPGIYALRVGFTTDSAIKPRKVYRQFDAQTGFVTHRFEFPKRQQQRIEASESSAIMISTRDEIQDGAWQLKEPLYVQVYREGGLLPLEAGAGPDGTQTP